MVRRGFSRSAGFAPPTVTVALAYTRPRLVRRATAREWAGAANLTVHTTRCFRFLAFGTSLQVTFALRPRGPLAPRGPVAPVAPVVPAGPCAPSAPFWPAGPGPVVGAATPVPLSAMSCGLPAALSLMRSAAARGPVAVGANLR